MTKVNRKDKFYFFETDQIAYPLEASKDALYLVRGITTDVNLIVQKIECSLWLNWYGNKQLLFSGTPAECYDFADQYIIDNYPCTTFTY